MSGDTSSWVRGRRVGPPVRLQHYIGGRFVDSPESFGKASPVTGEVLFEVADADSDTVDAAVTAARQALRGPWVR